MLCLQMQLRSEMSCLRRWQGHEKAGSQCKELNILVDTQEGSI